MISSTYTIRLLSTLGLLAASLLLPLSLQATHIIGGEISYQHLGYNKWRIRLDVYRDCSNQANAGFDSPAHISIYTENGQLLNNLNLAPLYTDTIPNNIAGAPCLFPPTEVCVQHARYEGTVILTEPGGYYFAYQRCCRNGSISSINDPSSTGATYWIFLSEAARQAGNNSPNFDNPPPVFVCVNEPIMHPYAAFDADGDSLVYSFYTPFTGASLSQPQPPFASPPPYDTVTWSIGYGLNNLLGPGSNVPLSINPETGLISGNPGITGQFVVGVQVLEYRNGVLLSSIRRDFQYNVGICKEIIPTPIAPAAQCDNLTVQFGNETEIAEQYIWYFNWPDTSLSSTEATPAFTFPDTGTYNVKLIAEPGNECEADTIIGIFLQNNSLQADFSLLMNDCQEESVLILQDLSTDSISPVAQWHWTLLYGDDTLTSQLQHPVFSIPNPSSGTITLEVVSQHGCVDVKTIQFETGGNNPIELLTDTLRLCLGDSISLNPQGSISGFTYQWAPPLAPGQQNEPSPLVSPTQHTTYSVTVTSYGGICTDSGQVTVLVFDHAALDFELDTDCDARLVHFVNQSQNAPFGYTWNFGDTSSTADTSLAVNPSYTYPAFGTYTVTLATAPNAVCKDTLHQEITLEEKILQAALSYAYEDCQEQSISIQFFDQSDNSLNNTTLRKWNFSGIYTDSSSLESPTITVTQEGILFVTLEITTDENCVAATDTISVEIDFTELPGMSSGSQVLGCLNGGTTLNPDADSSYTYSWTPAQGLSCTTCPSPFANPSETTTYTAVVTNISADTCEIIRQITVLVPEDVNLLASDDIATCDSTATLHASALISPVSFAWFDENGNQVAGDVTSLSVPVSGLNSYAVRATDAQGCHYYDTVMVKGGPVNILPIGEEIICSDQLPQVYATNLDLNDTLSWSWTPADAFTGPVDVPNPFYTAGPGENWLTVTALNQFGCSKTDSVYVAIVDINADLAFDYVLSCSGNSVEFINQSTGAFNYSWGFGDPTTSGDVSDLDNPVYTYSGEGTYQVYLTMDYNLPCVDTFWSEIQVSEIQFLADFDFDYLSCDEQSIQVQFFDNTQLLIDNIDITCWNWVASNGETSSLQNPVFTAHKGEPFSVTLNICTSNGCSDTITKDLNPQFTEISLSDTLVLCLGDSAYLNPLGNTTYIYHWTPDAAISNPDSPNPLVYPSATQVYSVDITTLSPDTCVISRTVTVFVPEAVELSVPGDTLTCGQPVTLQAVSSVSPVSFVWQDAQGNQIGSNDSQQVDPADAELYTVVATDAYQCTGSASVLVNNRQLDLLIDGNGGIIDTCPMPSYNLCVTNLDPNDLLTFEWTEAAGGAILSGADQPCATVTSTQGQTAFFFATVTNQWGCTSEEEFSITTYAFDPIFRELVTICPGVPTPINPGAVGSTLTYNWSPQVGLSCYDCPNPVATLDGSQFYEVTIQGFNPNEICSLTGTVQVQTTPHINLTTTPADTSLCGPVDLTLSALADSDIIAGYVWSQSPDFSNPLSTSNMLEITPQATSVYYVLATDTLGCMDTASATIHNYPIDISLAGNFNFCQEKGPLPIVAINNDPAQVLSFQWTPSDLVVESNADSSSISVVIPQTTVFTATVTNQYGCSTTESVTAAYFNIEAAIGPMSLSEDTIILYSGESSELYVDFYPGYSYEWTPQEGLDDPYVHNPVAMPTETTVYTVLVTDDGGCQTLRSDTVFVINPDCGAPNIYVPNAFTPNNDGRNDLLFVRSNIIEQVEFAIFNRWGQKVFETTDIQQGWDGTFKGELLSPDVYGYYLKATCFSGEEFFQKGNVTLLR